MSYQIGAGPADDRLPPIFREEQAADGTGSGGTNDVQSMVAEFYEPMHWSPQGVPTPGLLRELGLGGWVSECEVGDW